MPELKAKEGLRFVGEHEEILDTCCCNFSLPCEALFVSLLFLRFGHLLHLESYRLDFAPAPPWTMHRFPNLKLKTHILTDPASQTDLARHA